VDTEWSLERAWMRAVPINRMPWKAIPSVLGTAKLEELKSVYVSTGKVVVVVTDDNGDMTGLVTFEDLKTWLLDESLDQVVIASEVANINVMTLSEDDSLLDAIDVLDRETFEQVPIVSRENPKKVLGIISRNAVFSTYHKMIVKHGDDHTRNW